MTPVDLFPIGRSVRCTFAADGTLSLPQPVLERLGWTAGMRIAVRYLRQPLTLLLWAAPEERAAFTLSYLSRRGDSRRGGKLVCRGFANQIARARVQLPLRELAPAYLNGTPYQLALLLEEPAWALAPFSAAGVAALSPGDVGVYQLLGAADAVVRIGEGSVAERLRQHLRVEELVRATRAVRWVEQEKADAVVLERVLLALHRERCGALPRFNAVEA